MNVYAYGVPNTSGMTCSGSRLLEHVMLPTEISIHLTRFKQH